MIKAAVLGSPIGHSLSPALHKAAYAHLGVDASYGAIDLIPENASEFFNVALQQDWTGFSLTMPLKEVIVDIGFRIDPVALKMRSANTLIREGDTFFATSTDRSGFARIFDNSYQSLDKVAIIGGGGTARAALSALDGRCNKVDFLLRTPSRADLLKRIPEDVDVEFFGMDHPLRGYDLVISTVPAGVSDQIAADIDYSLPNFFEVLYNPYPTQLLQKAIAMGSVVHDGVDLLVEQALDQIALFSQSEFDYDQMRTLLKAVAHTHLA